MDKKIATLEHKKRMVYECFNNPFTYEFGSPDLHLPPITIDDRSCPHKIARYTPDLIPVSISVASGNYIITLTNPSDSPYIFTSDDPNTLHVMKNYFTFLGRMHRGYFCRKHGQKICYKKTRFYCSTYSDKNKKFYYCHEFSMIISETRTCFLVHQHYMSQFFS